MFLILLLRAELSPNLGLGLRLYIRPCQLAPTSTTSLEPSNRLTKMISRAVRISRFPSQVLARSSRTLSVHARHQSTSPQTATSAQPPQTQQAASSQLANARPHPSSVSHPALGEQPEERNSDNAIFLIFGGLLLAAAPLSYWYWGYRERAMKQKKEEMLRGIQERYAARHGNA